MNCVNWSRGQDNVVKLRGVDPLWNVPLNWISKPRPHIFALYYESRRGSFVCVWRCVGFRLVQLNFEAPGYSQVLIESQGLVSLFVSSPPQKSQTRGAGTHVYSGCSRSPCPVMSYRASAHLPLYFYCPLHRVTLY